MTRPPAGAPGEVGPRILVFSTDISDPGIDYAGSLHLHYSPRVDVLSVPCASGIRPGWILHAFAVGFDGVFIAADGDECAYLPDCSQRAARIVATAHQLMREAGYEPRRLRMAGICSVCAEQFGRYISDFADSLRGPGRAVAPVAGTGDPGPAAGSPAERSTT